MADSPTLQASTDLSQVVFQTTLEQPFRQEAKYENAAVSKVSTLSPEGFTGKSVTITTPADFAVSTTPLDEWVDPDLVNLTTSTVNVPVYEYGLATGTSRLARVTGFADVDRLSVEMLGHNAGITVDTINRNALQASTNIQYQANLANNAAITAAKTFNTLSLEIAYANFQTNNVPKLDNGTYVAFLHPSQVYDLRNNSGAGDFRYARENGSAGIGELKSGDIEGQWAGFSIISTSRNTVTADAGASSTVDVYSAYLVGKLGLAKVYSDHPECGPTPRFVMNDVNSNLRRRHVMGWTHIVGPKIFRSAAVIKLHTSSSLGTNS